MTFDTQFMQNAITRINELQQEIIEKSKQIQGSEEYVQEKLRLYEEDEKLRQMARNIHLEEKRITENFFNKK